MVYRFSGYEINRHKTKSYAVHCYELNITKEYRNMEIKKAKYKWQRKRRICIVIINNLIRHSQYNASLNEQIVIVWIGFKLDHIHTVTIDLLDPLFQIIHFILNE